MQDLPHCHNESFEDQKDGVAEVSLLQMRYWGRFDIDQSPCSQFCWLGNGNFEIIEIGSDLALRFHCYIFTQTSRIHEKIGYEQIRA